MRRLFLTIAFLLINGCATTYTMDKLSPQEKEYIQKVQATSPVFEVDKSQAEEAWSRGNSFVNRFSGMKIQSSNEYALSTYNPNSAESGTIGYELMKELNGKKVKFTVKCMYKFLNSKYTESVCRNNEKVMAHYMKTGELNEKFVDSVISTGENKSTAQQK